MVSGLASLADHRTPCRHRPHWFVLCQTEGKAYQPAEIPKWNESLALNELRIDRTPFKHLNRNAQGYALDRQVAVSPHKTLFHELAHVLLGHTADDARLDDDDSSTPRHLREAEAESVALICCESLGLSGPEFARGYIQHWLGKDQIPEKSAQRIFKAADQILRAGRVDSPPAVSKPA